MKLKRALGLVLAIALLPALSVLRKGQDVRAGTEWDIYIEACTFDAEKKYYVQASHNNGEIIQEGGKVSLNKYKAEAGEEITVTAIPDPGYIVSVISWGDGLADGTHIEESCKFTMWDKEAYVMVIFEPTQKNYYSYVRYSTTGPAYMTMESRILKTQGDAETYVLPSCTMEIYDPSYEFDYWIREGDPNKYQPGDPCPIGEDPVEFFAVFKSAGAAPYTVNYHPGYGSGSMASVTMYEDTAPYYILPDCEFTPPSGSQFIMWEHVGTNRFYRPFEQCSIPEEGATFQAWYMPDTYLNGSTFGAKFSPGEGAGTMADVEFDNPYDAFRYTLPECEFTAPEGKVFAYWKCVAYSYKPGDNYALPAGGWVTFEAIWKSAVPTSYVVSVGALNVRSGPSLYYDRIGGMTFGRGFQAVDEVLAEGEVWVCLDYQGQKGWVMRKHLLLTYSAETAVKPTKTSVTAGVLNVRSSPEKLDNPSNRITSFTNGKEFVVTGVIEGSDGNEWLCFEYNKDGVVRLAFVMAKYVEGEFEKKDISTHSLKIDFTVPVGELAEGKSAVALEDSVSLAKENLTSKNDGLLKAVIFPADAYNFTSLTKADITLPDGVGMEVMDLVLQEDGSIALTLCPENPVSVTFNDDSSGDVSTKYISSGKLIAKPVDPVKEGSTFDGWYEDKDFTTKFDFSKPVTGDIVLYSKFTKNGSSETPDSASTATQAEIVYTATVDSPSWKRGSKNGIVITVKRSENDSELCFLNFRGVNINGKALVLDKDYSAKKGSTIITIFPETLEALGDGEHTITVEFTDSKTEIKLSVEKPSGSAQTQTTGKKTTRVPKTGDIAPSYRNAALCGLCVTGLAAVVLMDRKKKEEK